MTRRSPTGSSVGVTSNRTPHGCSRCSSAFSRLRPRSSRAPSNGYSTLWLGEALRAVEGMLVSAESDPHRSELARRNLEAAGLEANVELRVADAGELLAESADGEWEVILLDAERTAYAGYWPDLMRTLAPRGMLAVDNVISHAPELTEFRRLVNDDPRVTDAVCLTGAGALLIARSDRAT